MAPVPHLGDEPGLDAELVYDNHPVDQPRSPDEGYHFTVDITDKALEFIQDAKAIAPDKPFFLYYAPGAAHAPHHATREWIERYAGKFDVGYEAMREQILARQKQMGIVPADTELPPLNPIGTPETRSGPDGLPFPPLDYTRPWDSLSQEEKRLFARMAEVYAGFVSHTDHHIGRLLDYLEESGQLEKTVVILVSPSYKAFFHHVRPAMELMCELLKAGRAPAQITEQDARADSRRGRNEPCTCGSGRKWKRCHGAVERYAVDS